MIRRVVEVSTVAALLGGLVGVGASVAATGHGQVGPNQFFVGTVNGLPSNVTIKVICPGPVNTGHALSGQPLEVNPPGPGTANLGFTGSRAKSIVADLATSSGVTASLAKFTRYGVAIAFPTSLPVPCSGTGVVRFDPAPGSPTARASSVTVTFANIGVGPH